MFARSPASHSRPHPSERPDLRPWLGLFLVAVAARALLRFAPDTWQIAPGAPGWLPLAASLARGAGFALPGPGGALVPTATVPPLAPFAGSLLLRTALPEPHGLEALFIVLGALVPLFTAGLGMAVFGLGAGWLAGLAAALDPFLVAAPPWVETTAALAMSVALLATAAWIKTPRPGRAFGVGVLWGAAVLAHASLAGLALALLAWAWVPLGLTLHPGDRTRQALLVLFALLLVVGPWTLRNAATQRAWVPVTTGNGVALAAAQDARAWSKPGAAALDATELAATHPELAGATPVEADRRGYALAWRQLTGDPAGAARAAGMRAAAFVAGPLTGAPRPLPWIALLGLPFVALGLLRALSGPRRLFQSFVLIAALYAIVCAAAYGAAAGGRVRFEPALALLAGVGADAVRRRVQARRHGLRVIAGGASRGGRGDDDPPLSAGRRSRP